MNARDVRLDAEYAQWIAELATRYRSSQIKASVKVNDEMLRFYWSVGEDIVNRQYENRYGSHFYENVSRDLKHALGLRKGLSPTTIKYTRYFYQLYSQLFANRQQPVDEIRHQPCDDLIPIRHQPGDELEMPEIFGVIPWKHHVYIFTKSQTVEEALFYIKKVVTEGLSRTQLEHQVDAHLFQLQGSAITNFDKTLPVSQIESARELLKKEYDLSFITVDAIKEEKDLENALAKNVTEFLLELGQGFAYLGRQRELRIDDESVFFPDLLFYHIPQRRYVIVELKAVKFMPEFAGKLNFYVTAADKLLRRSDDNPSVGLLICKTAKETIVEWSLQDIQKPLGVATYQLQEVVDRTIAEIEQQRKEKDL